MPLHDAMFVEPSPAPVKFAASLLGICTDEVRLPLVAATDAARATIRAALASAGIKSRPALRQAQGEDFWFPQAEPVEARGNKNAPWPRRRTTRTS